MLARARATLVETVQLKRRIVEDLRPSLLDNLGLAAALQSYCEDFARVTGLDCEALVEGDVDSAGPMHAIALFRIVQESLNNIAKYAQARTCRASGARRRGAGARSQRRRRRHSAGCDAPPEVAWPAGHARTGVAAGRDSRWTVA
jgi:hypothetical protein